MQTQLDSILSSSWTHLAAVHRGFVGWLLWSSSSPRTRWRHGALHKHTTKSQCKHDKHVNTFQDFFLPVNTHHFRELIDVLDWLQFSWQDVQVVAGFWPEIERRWSGYNGAHYDWLLTWEIIISQNIPIQTVYFTDSLLRPPLCACESQQKTIPR